MTIDEAFERMMTIVDEIGLPGIERSVSYGTPSLKVKGKFLARMKDEATLVIRCPLDEKQFLFDAAPDIYFQTDHYRGWDGLLIRLSAISPPELQDRIEQAWKMQASAKLKKEWESKC